MLYGSEVGAYRVFESGRAISTITTAMRPKTKTAATPLKSGVHRLLCTRSRSVRVLLGKRAWPDSPRVCCKR